MLAGVDLAVILDNFESKSWLTRKHILKLILCSIKVMVGTELLSLCPCPVFYQANSSAISYVGEKQFFSCAFSGDSMRQASGEFAEDPCSSVKRGNMVRAARALLSAVTHLLVLADMSDVYKLLVQLKLVTCSLSLLT